MDAGGREKVDVECAGDLKIFQAITRCLKSRPDPNNLSSLLVSRLCRSVTASLTLFLGYDCGVHDSEVGAVLTMPEEAWQQLFDSRSAAKQRDCQR